MNTVSIIMLCLFVGIFSYALGLHRGFKATDEDINRVNRQLDDLKEDYRNAYWEGYNDGRLDPHDRSKSEWYEEGFQDGKKAMRKELELPDPWNPEEENKPTKLELINEVVEQVGDLFDDDENNIIDCGEY